MMTSVHVPADSSDIGAFSGGSPRGVELEERLDRSLDALIKDRKKEEKAKKREEVVAKTKVSTPAASAKTPPRKTHQPKNVAAIKTQQTAKRSAIVSKNRGLPNAPLPNSAVAKNSKKATKKTANTKTSIAEVTAQLRHRIRGANNGSQRRTSIKSAKKISAATAASEQRIVRKMDTLAAKKPSASASQKKMKTVETAGDVRQPTKYVKRSVVRGNSKQGKLQITISSSKSKKPDRFTKASSTGKKLQPLAPKKKVTEGKKSVRKQSASVKKPGKLVKKSRKHQGNALVAVRQPFGSRKKN